MSGAGSHTQNPHDLHRLGWAPRPFPRTGMTGSPNSSIMARMGTGSLSVYTDVDREEFEDQSGMPGSGGNYKAGMSRQYKKMGGGKAMLGAPQGMSEESLRNTIKSVIEEDRNGQSAFNYEMLSAAEGDDEDDAEPDLEEFSGAASVAGYSLPLGLSNRAKGQEPPYASYARALNGTPVKVVGSKTLKIIRLPKKE